MFVVLVAGLPEPNKEHAVVVAKFARECLKKMKSITMKLEVALGPDTSDLDLRIGIHSGQVTAGVLRGQRSRFQLFGDTMNTAARMESTSERNKIQISSATADLLRGTEVGHLVKKRENKIFVKGKGEMQTYWISRSAKSRRNKAKSSGDEKDKLDVVMDYGGTDDHDMEQMVHVDEDSTCKVADDFEDEEEAYFDGASHENLNTKKSRLVEWNVEVLAKMIQQILAARNNGKSGKIDESEWAAKINAAEEEMTSGGNAETVLDEFVPIIPLKRFDANDMATRRRPSSVEIDPQVKCQLRNYLSNIADMYQEANPFHNFEHASHVTASVKKLLSRIVQVDEGKYLDGGRRQPSRRGFDLQDLAGHSYGITSDPLTQFSVVFSAVIHDVDHPGVPNTQLVKENTRNAQFYKKSIAEQNSVDLAWHMLMGDEYSLLRSCIYQNEEELKRFRQLVVNTVLATDICDKELQALRKNRWESAFNSEDTAAGKEEATVFNEDRKATIVIEHLIQASDVSHTMQHWHIYKDWNQKFFMECYGAFREGRADSDPSLGWYKGEIGFFDFYIVSVLRTGPFRIATI